jgi:hypothetical protein
MKHNQKQKHYLPVIIPLFALLIIGQLAANYYFYRQTHRVHDNTILSLITQAVDGLHRPAPVDPKTGDTYLPEARLVIPASQDGQQILYSYTSYDGTRELSITGQRLMGVAKSKLWSSYSGATYDQAEAMTAVFEAVPNLQACSRGIQLFTKERADKNYIKQFTATTSDATWHAYTEPGCTKTMGITTLVDQVKTMRPY